MTTSDDFDNPVTVEEALSRPDNLRWKQALLEEMQYFEENEAWEIVDGLDSGTVVQCKWVFKKKFDSNNQCKV